VLIGERFLVGYDDDTTTGAEYLAQIEACRRGHCADPLAGLPAGWPAPDVAATVPAPVESHSAPERIRVPLLGEVELRRLSLPALTVLLAALDGFKQSFCAQMVAQFGPLLNSFAAQIDALERQMAQAVAQSAVLLARRVVRGELQTRPEHVAEVAQQAVNAVLLSARHIRVMVNPEDHALVAAGAAEALQARGARLLPAAEVERGGCLIESDLGQIDARIEARWRQAAGMLGCELPWQDDSTPPP